MVNVGNTSCVEVRSPSPQNTAITIDKDRLCEVVVLVAPSAEMASQVCQFLTYLFNKAQCLSVLCYILCQIVAFTLPTDMILFHSQLMYFIIQNFTL